MQTALFPHAPLPLPTTANLSPERVFDAGMRAHHIANTAYPIAHHKTIWQHRVDRNDHTAVLRRAFSPHEPFGLYAHIPFCERRCKFCEYTVVDHHDPEVEAQYHDALLREIDLWADHVLRTRRALVGFDIGGGTPSLIQPERIVQLVEHVRSRFDLAPGFGISIETTPKVAALSPERLRAYRACGIDRISMGLQMINPRLLRAYDRDLHRVGFNRPAVDNMRTAGFSTINIDLMYGFARQSPQDFRASLRAAVDLDPEVITLYRMRYKGTRVQAEAEGVTLDHVMALYDVAREVLPSAGYGAPPGKNAFTKRPEDPGTSAYLTRRVVDGAPYLGVGLGAQTFAGTVLAYGLGAASKRLDPYLRAVAEGRLPVQDLYDLPEHEAMAKMIAVSFYFGAVRLASFRHRFARDLLDGFSAETHFLLHRGLMVLDGGELRLTEAGAHAFPGVVALFYSPSVKQHLLSLP
jgi:oxygen-independent coproporphyrinogen-3 oxidase